MPTPYTNPFFKELNILISDLKDKQITIKSLPTGFTGKRLILDDELTTELLMNLYGTSIGFYIEQAVFDFLQENQNILSKYGFRIDHNIQGTVNDYTLYFNLNNETFTIKVDSKSSLKNSNSKLSNNQIRELLNQQEITSDNEIKSKSYIIYCLYELSAGKIEETIVTIKDAYFMPIQYAVTSKHRITNTVYNNVTKNYIEQQSKLGNKVNSIYENLSLSQALSSIDLYYNQNINESKKHVMVKKFIEENFNKKGDYLYPKNGDSKCDFHAEYDKGLLKFFAQHGITEIYSIYDTHAPSLGFSQDEQKWYGWSHRAIYGFGIGDSMKKGCCGFEIYKKTAKAKTLADAKEMAKAFAKSVG